MTYDFSRLTERQSELLTFGGWHVGCGRQQPSKKTVSKLLERGLLVARETTQRIPGLIPIAVTEYDVPIAVQAAWEAQCR